MDIIQRNLVLLLRSGAFQTMEDIEPMSAFKWGRLYQLAVMHNIIPFVYDGIIRSKNLFFLHLTEKQKKDWEKAIADYRAQEKKQDEQEEDEYLRPDRLVFSPEPDSLRWLSPSLSSVSPSDAGKTGSWSG